MSRIMGTGIKGTVYLIALKAVSVIRGAVN